MTLAKPPHPRWPTLRWRMALTGLLMLAAFGRAQLTYGSVTGLLNVNVSAGDNVLAVPFEAPTNTVAALFPNAGNGCSVFKFDPVAKTFQTTTKVLGAWSVPEMTLVPGEAFIFRTLAATTISYAGTIREGTLSTPIAVGTNWLSSQVALAGLLSTDLAFPVVSGDTVLLVEGGSTNVFTFSGSAWSPTEPTLGVGKGFELRTTQARTWSRVFALGGSYPNSPYPTIHAQPAGRIVGAGAPATFSVGASVASSVGPLSYQWRRNGVAIPSATSASYTVASAQTENLGDYDVLVSGSTGAGYSAVASLAVSSLIAPAGSASLDFLTVNGSGSNPVFDVDSTTRLSGSAGWLAQVYAGITADEANFGAYAAPVAFSTGGAAGFVNGGPQTGFPGFGGQQLFLQIRVWNTANGATYEAASAVVGSKVGKSSVFAVTAGGTPQGGGVPFANPIVSGFTSFSVAVKTPVILVQPASVSVAAGGTATFSVTAAGSAPLAYQWRSNSLSIATATNASFTLTNVQASFAASYSVVVTNAYGSITSAPAVLTVRDNVLVFTLAGSGIATYAEGPGTSASFYAPNGVAVDAAGNVYVADYDNHRIRKVTAGGVVSTMAGSGSASFADGLGTSAGFRTPRGVAVDAAGNVYVADYGNFRVRKVTAGGVVSTLAGNGSASFADGLGTSAGFHTPRGVAVDAAGNVYVADFNNHRIRKVTAGGVVSTLAGNGNDAFADGSGTSASLSHPSGVAVDAVGNVYVADAVYNRIRKVTAGGVVSTLAGNGSSSFADGLGTSASFYSPSGVAVDAVGNVYVADYRNHRIRKVTPGGLVSTLAGGGTQGSTDGPGASASFANPYGVAVDSAGNVYVADTSNHKIRKILVNDVAPTVIGMAEGQTAVRGTNVAWSIAAFSLSPMGFQWYSNSVPIAGATGTNLVLGSAQLNWSGTYSVVATNAVGATTNTVILTVEEFGTPHIAVSGTVPGGSNLFGGSATVTITSAIPGALIRYSLDGVTAPTFGGPFTYSGPFTVTSNVTVRAVALDPNDIGVSATSAPLSLTILPVYSLNLTTTGGGAVAKNPSAASYLSNSAVTITAAPDAGWQFLYWMGDTNGVGAGTSGPAGATNTITLDRPRNVQAVFGAPLTTSVFGGSGGTVESLPVGGVYPYGSVVRVTARPTAGKYFSGWAGNAGGGSTSNPFNYTNTLSGRTLTAVFSDLGAGQVTLDVQVNGNGTVAVNPQKNVYNQNEVVTVTATPETVMQRFTVWSGASTATIDVLNLTLNSSETLTASFSPVPPGTVVAWGRNDQGQTNVPTGLSGVVAVAAGSQHTVALKSNGTVVAWGANGNGQINVPTGLSGVVAVAAGHQHTVALKSNGTVVEWGGGSPIPTGLSGVMAVAAGAFHTVALKSDGTVVCWGSNSSGQSTVPAGLTNVVAIAAGSSHTVALRYDGTVVAWGWNDYGQLNVPAGLNSVMGVAGGWLHTVGLKMDGTVVAWGEGFGNSVWFSTNLTGVIAVAAGTAFTVALKADGTVVQNSISSEARVPEGLSNATAIATGNSFTVAVVGAAREPMPPVFMSQPETRAVSVGSNTAFSVAATDYAHAGLAPQLAYQWSSNSVPIAGATNSWLTLTNVQPSYAAGYSMVITNAHGAVTSAVAALTVLLPQTITFPQIANRILGDAPLSLNATSDSPLPVSYTVVSGSASVSSNLLTLTGGGTVTVRASQPGNSNYLAAPNVERSFEVLVTLTTPVAGGGTVSRSLDLPGYTNNTTVQLMAVPNAGDVFLGWAGDASGTQNPLSVQLSTNKTVTARFGTPPSLTTQPLATNLPALGTLNLLASASGTAPLAYQWRRDGVALVGQTGPNLTIANVNTDHAGIYTLVVTNEAGAATSAAAVVTINRLLPTITWPTPAAITYGTPLSGAQLTALGSVPGGFTYLPSNGQALPAGSHVLSATLTPADVSVYSNATLSVTQVVNQAALTIRAEDKSRRYGEANPPLTVSYTGFQSGDTNTVLTGQPALSVVAPTNAVVGTYPITITNTVAVTNANYAISYQPGMLTVFADAVAFTNQPADRTVVEGTDVSFGVGMSGTLPFGYQWRKDSNVVAQATNATLTLTNVLPGQSGYYDVVVSNPAGLTNSRAARLVVLELPRVVAPPTNLTVVVSNDVTMAVAVSGTSPFSYQWFKDGGTLLGATNASFTLAQVRTNDAGSYRVVITNAAGSVTSNPALLTVNRLGQTITFDPLVSVRADASPFSLSASASSRLAVVYTSSDTNVAVVSAGVVGIRGVGTTVITATQEGNESYAPAAAVGRTLTVTPVPASIIFVPTSRTFTVGQNAALTVGAAGIPRAFQWYRDGLPVAGATGSTLAFGRARPEHAGLYSVVVSNSLGSVTSSPPAVVSVLPDPTAGSVIAWGSNASGQTNVPPTAMSGVVAVAAGNAHTVALKSDGAVLAWGTNQSGQISVPVSAQSGVIQIAAAYAHTVALKNDGAVIAWGTNEYGQINVPPAAQAGVIAVAAGGSHSLALKNDGSVVAWGANSLFQTNVPPAAQSFVVAIAAGDDNSLALRRDGSVVAWGGNFFGQSTVPPEAMADVVALATGDGHVAVLKSDGSIFSWGNNFFGQANVPTAAQFGVVSVAAGDNHTMALKSDGSVFAWGFNGSGQTNVPLMAASNAFGIAAGGSHSVALVRLPPAITSGPTNLLVGEHEDATFSVGVSGASPFSYQWFQGAVPLPGRTNAVLVLTNVGVAQIGSYTVTVSNALGSVTSGPALLTVNRLGQTIVFDVLPDRILGAAAFDLSASASSGLPVLFTLVSGPASLISNRLTLNNLTGGRVTVQASQPGNSNYLAATSVVQSFDVLLKLDTSAIGAGSVSNAPTGNTFANGTEVVITATADAGHAFVGWTGSVTNLSNPLRLVMDTNRQVTANFLPVYALTVPNSLGGQVILQPSAGPYLSNTTVQATAIVSNGYSFAGWTGVDTATGAVATVQMHSNRTLSATFYPLRTLATNVVGSGYIQQTPTGTIFTNGVVVNLMAVTNAGTSFLGWSGSSNTLANPLQVVMDGDKSFTATFQTDAQVPVITITNGLPASAVTNENLSLQGRVTDNDGVKSLTWRLNGGATNALGFTNDGFTLNLALAIPGTNVIEILAEDQAGNRGTNRVAVVWQPVRFISLLSVLPNGDTTSSVGTIQEGATARFRVTLNSSGEVRGVWLRIGYDASRLKAPIVVFSRGSDFLSTPYVQGSTGEVRISMIGHMPAGNVDLFSIDFASLSIPAPKLTDLTMENLGLSHFTGTNRLEFGNHIQGARLEIYQRTYLGDVDGNGANTVGDLPPLLQLLNSTNRQLWDEDLNDINRQGGFEVADVVLAARIANKASQPVRRLNPQGSSLKLAQSRIPQSSVPATGSGFLEIEPIWQADKLVAVVKLNGNTNSIYAVALRCRYPGTQLIHLGETIGVTPGAIMPATIRAPDVANVAEGVNVLYYGTNAWSASNGELLRLGFSIPNGAAIGEFPFEVEGELVPSINGGDAPMASTRAVLRYEAGMVSPALPIHLSAPVRTAGNTFSIPLTRSDFTPFSPVRTNWFEVWVSTNLASPTNWTLWLNPPFRQTNGITVLDDQTTPGANRKFYRVIER